MAFAFHWISSTCIEKPSKQATEHILGATYFSGLQKKSRTANDNVFLIFFKSIGIVILCIFNIAQSSLAKNTKKDKYVLSQ